MARNSVLTIPYSPKPTKIRVPADFYILILHFSDDMKIKIDGSPYENPDDSSESGERGDVGDQLWSLQRMGLARHEKNLWYPD